MKILDNFIRHGRAQQWYGRACKLPSKNTSQKHRHDPCLQWHGRANPPDRFVLLLLLVQAAFFSLFLTKSPRFLVEHSIDVFLGA